MGISKENMIQRVKCLLDVANRPEPPDYDTSLSIQGEVVSGTINLLEILYGATSQKCASYRKQEELFKGHAPWAKVAVALGVLRSIKAEIEAGLVGNLQLQAQAGVFGDFITLARESLDENKDVAAVLVCAALEDALKRFALQNSLDVVEKDMSQVVNAIKGKGLLKEPQASIVQSYVKLRNKAFHAQWDKIEKESVNAAIGFTETFLVNNFG